MVTEAARLEGAAEVDIDDVVTSAVNPRGKAVVRRKSKLRRIGMIMSRGRENDNCRLRLRRAERIGN